MANDKVFSVRTDDETLKKLETLADESGMRKADLLPVLIDCYAREQAKGALPNRSTEIDNVRSLLAQIDHAYLASLELAANADARIREEYAARLATNEQAVASLKEKADKAASEAKEVKDALADTKEERDAEAARADAAEEELEKLQGEAAEEKDRLLKFNSSLQAQVDVLKEKADAAAAELEAAAALESENAKIKDELTEVTGRAERAEREADELQKKLDDAKEKANLEATELKGRYDEKIDNRREKLKNEKEAAVLDARSDGEAQLRSAVAAADEKHQERIDKMQAAIDKLTEQRDAWQEKFYALRDEGDQKKTAIRQKEVHE